MKTYNETVQVNDGLKADIEVNHFRVEVTGSEKCGKAEIEISTAEYENPEELFKVEYRKEDNILTIKELEQQDKIQKGKAMLKLTVPFESDISIKSDNSPIILTDLKGELNAKSRNGSVKITQCLGKASAETRNGALILKKNEGTVNLKTMNGSIEISEGRGSLQAETGNGSVRCNNTLFDRVEVTVKNGSIYYELPTIEKGMFNLTSKNGPVRVFVPTELPFNITAKNENGRFNFALSDNYETGREGNRKIIKSVRGSGKVAVEVQNVNGSISIFSDKSTRQQTFSIPFDPEQFPWMNEGDMQTDKLGKDFKRSIRKMVIKNLKKAGILNEEDTNQDKPETDEKETVSQEETTDFGNLEGKVLQMLEQGIISADEAEMLIDAMKKED